MARKNPVEEPSSPAKESTDQKKAPAPAPAPAPASVKQTQSPPSERRGRPFVKYFLVVIVAVLLALGFPGDIGIPNEGRTILGDLAYDIKVIDAPVATGLKLRVLSYLMSHGPLAPAIRRMLLNQNQFHKLRELSAQIEGSKFVPLTHPIQRHPGFDLQQKAYQQYASQKSLIET